MRQTIVFLFFGLLQVFVNGQQLPLLKVSDNKKYIVTQDNEPFLWLGGTAWELIHRLNREEIIFYLKNRSEKGFTLIQTVILSEDDGLNKPNAYGEVPLLNHDPTQLNEKYFEHVDFVVKQAEALGMYIGLLPTWGDKFSKKWNDGPEIFTPENAEIYGELIAQRYKDQNNIIWILGGDRVPETELHSKIIRAMARGIRKVDSIHLITYHPWGNEIASTYFNDNWLDLDMFQTVHDRRTKDYTFVQAGIAVEPRRPIINGEPRYENIPDRLNQKAEFGWLDDSDVRTSAYWTMLAGAAGYTYGCNDIFQMYSNKSKPLMLARTDWNVAVYLPGSKHISYLKNILEVFPWFTLINDQSIILNENPKDSTHIICSIGEKKDFLLAYSPFGKPIKLNLSKIDAEIVSAFWYNTRSGKSVEIGNFKTEDIVEFKTWSYGRGSDFLLVIFDINSSYKIP